MSDWIGRKSAFVIKEFVIIVIITIIIIIIRYMRA